MEDDSIWWQLGARLDVNRALMSPGDQDEAPPVYEVFEVSSKRDSFRSVAAAKVFQTLADARAACGCVAEAFDHLLGVQTLVDCYVGESMDPNLRAYAAVLHPRPQGVPFGMLSQYLHPLAREGVGGITPLELVAEDIVAVLLAIIRTGFVFKVGSPSMAIETFERDWPYEQVDAAQDLRDALFTLIPAQRAESALEVGNRPEVKVIRERRLESRVEMHFAGFVQSWRCESREDLRDGLFLEFKRAWETPGHTHADESTLPPGVPIGTRYSEWLAGAVDMLRSFVTPTVHALGCSGDLADCHVQSRVAFCKAITEQAGATCEENWDKVVAGARTIVKYVLCGLTKPSRFGQEHQRMMRRLLHMLKVDLCGS